MPKMFYCVLCCAVLCVHEFVYYYTLLITLHDCSVYIATSLHSKLANN